VQYRIRRFAALPFVVAAVTLALLNVAPAGAAQSSQSVTDALGVHSAGLADVPFAKTGVNSPDAGSGCAPTTVWNTSGQVFLQNGWTALAIRSGSCTNGTLFGYHRGPFYKNRATHGQFICRGHLTYGYGTNTWYDDLWDYPHGWSWAGGTNQPFWDGSC
jgi:hypothetical protein